MANSLADDIKSYMHSRAQIGKWVYPTTQDALNFLVSEVGELLDAYMRMHSPLYYRNHDREVSVSEELGDVVFMCYVAADAWNVDLDATIRHKLATTRLPEASTR